MTALLALLLAAPLTLRFDDAEVRRIVAEVFARTDALIDVDKQFLDKKISLDVDGWQLPEVLEEIAKRVGGEVYNEPNGPFRIVPAWKRTLLKRLHETRVKLHLDDAAPLRSVVQTFRQLTGVPVVLDPARKEWSELELNVDDVTGAQLLDLMTAPYELAWDLRYGVVFVSTRARLAELPARRDLAGLPDKRIALDLKEAGRPAIEELLKRAGVEVKGSFPKDATVTLGVPSIELRHAVELIYLPHGCDVATENGVLVVRKWIPPTPYPDGFPELKKEAEALDRARRLESKDELDKVSKEASERLDRTLERSPQSWEFPWYAVYRAEWMILRGAQVDKEQREFIVEILKVIEESEPADYDEDGQRLLTAARAARKRLEAASK